MAVIDTIPEAVFSAMLLENTEASRGIQFLSAHIAVPNMNVSSGRDSVFQPCTTIFSSMNPWCSSS